MPRPVSIGALFAAVIAMGAMPAAAPAAVPDPRFSHVTPVLVGTPGGDLILQPPPITGPEGPGFHIDLRDVANAPMRGEFATIDFAGSPTIRIFSERQAGVTVDCVNRRIYGITGADGGFTFFPRFGGFDNATHVWAEGSDVVLTQVSARSTDMDAQGGETGLGDLAILARLLLAGSSNHPEADFDGSGGPIDPRDFVIFARSMLGAARGQYCP